LAEQQVHVVLQGRATVQLLFEPRFDYAREKVIFQATGDTVTANGKNVVERGRQMHNQALFELFARSVSKAIQALKKCCGITIRKQGSRAVYLKQT
jgi:hypothetical protein